MAVAILYATRMLLSILSSVARLTVQYFSTLSHEQRGCRKKLLNTGYVFLFSLQILSEIFLILRRTGPGIFINVNNFPFKIPIILVRLQ